MVVIGGYTIFVSNLNLDGHSNRPNSLSRVDPGTIKVKRTASLSGISRIHLLKAFDDVANEPASISNGRSRSIRPSSDLWFSWPGQIGSRRRTRNPKPGIRINTV